MKTKKIFNKFNETILYLTNNETTSKDEIKFDLIFWIAATLAFLTSIPLLIFNREYGWVFIVIIFYLEFWDSLRHNRE